MTDDPIEKLADIELRATEALEPILREHLDIARDAWRLLYKAITALHARSPDDIPLSARVSIGLLARMANDVRSAERHARQGYALQACSAVSSVFEAAYAVALIGASDERAQKWVDHDSPTASFEKTRRMIETVITEDDSAHDKERAIELERMNYAQLCMARHANPLLQMQHGVEDRGDKVGWIVGPDVAEAAIRASWFALEAAARLTCIAVARFALSHVADKGATDLPQRTAALGRERSRLADKAVQKGWNTDPFAGKWFAKAKKQ